MNMKKETSELFDKYIFVFLLLFALTLTNSIFLNQIGYFGALILILIKISVNKKSEFRKIGLELPFLLFILAELISAILSINKPQAFQNFFKRIILIPIVYLMVSVINDDKKAKIILYAFLTAALLTIITYIAFAYRHFVHQLYRLESKGPSPFQYVMTAGGLISMVTIYFFAFAINNKKLDKYKVIYAVSFLITISALIASYTRAAWLGAISGIVVILIVKKKWVVLSVFGLILIAALVLIKNESNVIFYKIQNSKVIPVKQWNTKGKAYTIKYYDNKYFVTDYNDGILVADSNGINPAAKTPAPVVNLSLWNNFVIAKLVDSRFVIYKPDKKTLKLNFINEFVSPGNTKGFIVKNHYLYVADYDSGLTVFKNPENPDIFSRFGKINKSKSLAVSGKYLSIYNFEKQNLEVYKLNNYLPGKLIYQKHFDVKYLGMWLDDSKLFLDGNEGLQIYDLTNNLSVVSEAPELKNIVGFKLTGDSVITASASGKFTISKIVNKQLNRLLFSDLNISISGMDFGNNVLAVTHRKSNRLLSVVDIYYQTNLQRINQWKVGFKILKKYPVFGVGDIDLQKVYSKFKPYYLKENFGHLHNNYVQIIVILGIFGFLVVIYLLIKIFIIDWKIYKSVQSDKIASSFALGTIGVFVAFLVSGLAEWNFGDQEIITMIWFTLGLNLAFYYNMQKHLNGKNKVE